MFKPFIARTVLLGSYQTGNFERAKSYYPQLKSYLNCWFTFDSDRNGLAYWLGVADHSGMDNQFSRCVGKSEGAETGAGLGLNPFFGWSSLAYFLPVEIAMDYDPTDFRNSEIQKLAEPVEVEFPPVKPYLPQKQNFGGQPVDDAAHFVPSVGDYTLEVEGTQGIEIRIEFANLAYTPTQSGKIRFTQQNGTVCVYEGDEYKTSLIPTPQYGTGGQNILANPSFEQVQEQMSAGRWKAQNWTAWSEAGETWGTATGKVNVRENYKYRSDGAKSIYYAQRFPLPDTDLAGQCT